MLKHISTLDMRQSLGHVLDSVSIGNEQYVIERKGKPLAAIVPVWLLEKLQAEGAHYFQEMQAFHAGKTVAADKLDADIHEAIRAVRRKKRS